MKLDYTGNVTYYNGNKILLFIFKKPIKLL